MEQIMSAKTVFVHRNGVNRAPKTIIVNPRQVRTFDSLLDKVTSSLKTPGAVRTICTPTGRHRINKLDQLEDERAYVAVGSEGFKRIDYSNISEIGSGRPAPRKELAVIEPVKHNTRIVVSGRARRIGETEPLGNKVISVFANGDALSPAKSILLKKNNLKSLDEVLKEVNNRVELQTGAVRALYELKSGHMVNDSSELRNKEVYVAVGSEKKLKKLNYLSHESTQMTPRRALTKVRIPPPRKGNHSVKKAKHQQKKSPSEREQTKDSPSFLERVGDKIDDVTNGNDQLSREATKDSLKRQKSRDSPSFLERVEGKLDDFTGGNGQRSREATKDSLKREKTRDSPSFLERVGDKLDDVTNGKEQRSREATKDSLKREKTRDSPSFLEQVADKISDVIDGDGSSENGDRIGTESGQQQQTNTRQNSDAERKVYDASGEQEVKGEVIGEDNNTQEDKPIDMLPPEEVTEELIEDEENAQ